MNQAMDRLPQFASTIELGPALLIYVPFLLVSNRKGLLWFAQLFSARPAVVSHDHGHYGFLSV
jgi:hypothetical protein